MSQYLELYSDSRLSLINSLNHLVYRSHTVIVEIQYTHGRIQDLAMGGGARFLAKRVTYTSEASYE